VQEKEGVKPIPPPFLANRITKIGKRWMSGIQKGLSPYNQGINPKL
jgi:hypothetical protein